MDLCSHRLSGERTMVLAPWFLPLHQTFQHRISPLSSPTAFHPDRAPTASGCTAWRFENRFEPFDWTRTLDVYRNRQVPSRYTDCQSADAKDKEEIGEASMTTENDYWDGPNRARNTQNLMEKEAADMKAFGARAYEAQPSQCGVGVGGGAMRNRLTFVSLAVLVVLALAVAALAGPPFRAKPFEYDPTNTGIVEAVWIPHEGLPDSGNSNHALFLAKDGLTATNASAGAILQGVAGITLTELGYDVRDDGHCGAGAPRFNVTMSSDGLHFIGCAAGPVTGSFTDPQGNTWTRKRWNAAALANPGITFPPITALSGTVVSIAIVFDEGTDQGEGFTHLDNIDVNTVLIGKPGNAF
jgi:hypothetical protein